MRSVDAGQGRTEQNLRHPYSRRFFLERKLVPLQKSGGRIFVISSSIIAVVGALGFLVPAAHQPIYTIIAAVITLGSIIGAGLLVLLIS